MEIHARVSDSGPDDGLEGSAGAPWFLEGRGLRERGEGEHFLWVTFCSFKAVLIWELLGASFLKTPWLPRNRCNVGGARWCV